MAQPPKYSVVIPVYNRPDEVRELLESLTKQTVSDFEVIIVEDGSTIRCEDVVNQFVDRLVIDYVFKPNSGPGPSRNVGYSRARGNYFVVFDSDCVIPPAYFEIVNKAMEAAKFDAWGGPDRAHQNFTALQQAMGYTMSSVLTTGGIRGAKKHIGSFQPRSFNMGISRAVFEKTGGFKFERLAEDIELSIRMKKMNFISILIPDAFVYHKRRTNLKQFYNQVSNFGRGRILVGKAHPGEVKITHWFPTIFIAGMFMTLLLAIGWPEIAMGLSCAYVLYFVSIFIDSLRINGNLKVAFLSIQAAFIQLFGYGFGFFKQWVKSYIAKSPLY
jgi:glycosyltransferase involved in cell wall biosynthesis